jgi:predicted NBD/HSP70 family sugar kinase
MAAAGTTRNAARVVAAGHARADQATVRRSNLSLVLRHLSEQGPRSRSLLAAETGLNKATISSLVAELLDRGLVSEQGPQHAGAVGRPGLTVALDGARVGALGLEINVDYIAAYGTDLAGRVVVERRLSFDAMGSGPEASLRELARVINGALAEFAAVGATIAGITVAVPGLVDVSTGTVVVAPNLRWYDVPVPRMLSAAGMTTAMPVAVDNDANLAALAEYHGGVAAGTPDLVYLTGEVGVGGGVIIGGNLIRGADGFAGEVGHILVDPQGSPCGCGRVGCWETKVGLAALVRQATPDHAYGMDLGWVPDPEERLAEIGRRLAQRDAQVSTALTEVGRWLGRGGATLVNLFNPRVIVLGGYFARVGAWVLDAAQAELDQLTFAGLAGRCRFVASNLGFGAAARGAAAVAIERVLADPTSVAGGAVPAGQEA